MYMLRTKFDKGGRRRGAVRGRRAVGLVSVVAALGLVGSFVAVAAIQPAASTISSVVQSKMGIARDTQSDRIQKNIMPEDSSWMGNGNSGLRSSGVDPGLDYWVTTDPTDITFGGGDIPVIPADFFFAGSPPFSGTVCLQGVPIDPGSLGDTDTIVERLDPAPLLPGPDLIPVEMIQLELKSCSPIAVTDTSGWVLEVSLDPLTPSLGAMTIDHSNSPDGGLFSSSILVCPILTFTPAGGGPSHVLNDSVPVGCIQLTQDTPHSWLHLPSSPPFPNQGPNFFPTPEPNVEIHPGGAVHTVIPPLPPIPLPPPDLFADWRPVPVDPTQLGAAQVTLGNGAAYPPIPAGFFGATSNAFQGTIPVRGTAVSVPDGPSSTILQRDDDPLQLSDLPGSAGSVQIELVALSLVSVDPVQVTHNDGSTSQWAMDVLLPPDPQIPGFLNAQKTHNNGGTFDSFFDVAPILLFTRVGAPSEVRVLSGLPSLQLQVQGADWVHTVDPGLGIDVDPAALFVPGVFDDGSGPASGVPGNQQVRIVQAVSTDGLTIFHFVCPPPPPPPPDPHATWVDADPAVGELTHVEFGNGPAIPPIPADFFNPGSEPFIGTIAMRGSPFDAAVSNSSVLVARVADPVTPADPDGTTRTVQTEMISMSLQSVEPIIVTYLTAPPEIWSLSVSNIGSSGLDGVRRKISNLGSSGCDSVTATKTHGNGGTFFGDFEMCPLLIFTRDSDGSQRSLDLCEPGTCDDGSACSARAQNCLGSHCAGTTQTCSSDLDCAGLGVSCDPDICVSDSGPLTFDLSGDFVFNVDPSLGLIIPPGALWTAGVDGSSGVQVVSPVLATTLDIPPSVGHTVCPPSGGEECIYEIICVEGDCSTCPAAIAGKCRAASCPNATCPSLLGQFSQCNSGAPGGTCCIEFGPVLCTTPTNEPLCPAVGQCTCSQQSGAFCEADGTCCVGDATTCSGTFVGGNDCGPLGACCDASGVCSLELEKCCLGTWHPQDCQQPEACCLPDAVGGVMCQDLDPLCCKDLGGNPQGAGSVCDADGDGTDEACIPPVFCPIPNTQVCASQQPTNCISSDPLTPDVCLPNALTLQSFNGQLVPVAEVNACSCETPGQGCGPVQTSQLPGGGMGFRCDGPCPDPTQPCFIHLSGVSVGANYIEFFGPVKEVITCECAGNPGTCCEAGTGICLTTLQSACPGTWFGGPCQPLEPCCFGDNCVDLDPRCCVAEGGTVQPAGTTCSAVDEACCMTDAAGVSTCIDMDPLCCHDQGGNPQGVGTTCLNINGCDNPPLVCPMLATDNLCANLQASECQTNDPASPDDCRATSVSIVQDATGLVLQANTCACTGDVCGPVTAIPIPGTTSFDVSCENLCPNPPGNEPCYLHIGGVSQGVSTAVYSGPISDLTCGCASNPGSCCEIGTGICFSSLQVDCQGTWFGGPCQTPEPCCLGNSCVDLDPRCCVAQGGTVQPAGTTCDSSGATEACCLTDAAGTVSCQDMDALCCTDQGGNPQGVGTTCLNINGCMNPPLVCPMPSSDKLCEDLQAIECQTNDPATSDDCRATSVSIVQDATGFVLQANTCACAGDVCGPVTAVPIPGTTSFDVSCQNNCPVGAGKCVIHIAGVSTGNVSQSYSGPVSDLTCECASDPGTCCEIGTGICLSSLQADCQGTWFGGPCLPLEPCCFGDNCVDLDPRCCAAEGGTVQPAGTACDPSGAQEACCLSDAAGVVSCVDMDALCCNDQGGNPQGVGTTCVNINGCNNPPLFCPMPPTNKLCKQLQFTECDTTDPTTLNNCLATSISIVQDATGLVLQANTCACDPGACGPVTAIPVPGTPFFDVSCENNCPNANEPCLIHIGGVSTGAVSQSYSGPISDLTCECASNPGTCCEVGTGICLTTLQADCQGTWFGGPCLPLQPCCFGDNCVDLDPRCCAAEGGTVQPAGSACDPNGATEACCIDDAAGVVSCLDMDALCCADQGGNPQGVGTTCVNINGCDNPPLVCPMPATDKLCEMLQATECMTTDPTTPDNCQATSISIVQDATGLVAVANSCACAGDTCGPITAKPIPGTPFVDVSCQNLCPNVNEPCLIHVNGVSTGGAGISFISPVDNLTCECASNPGACCDASGCSVTLQADCLGTWFGGPCLPPVACCLGDSCVDMDPRCCESIGGVPQAAGDTCAPAGQAEACCLPNAVGGTDCRDIDPLCCIEQGGMPLGLGSACLGDANGDGDDDACAPGVCEPTTDKQACESVNCPDGPAGTVEACQPQCVTWNPLTQSYQITECDCKGTDECHVDVTPVGGRLDPECVVVDDGTGTATLPPPGCPYLSPDEFHMIVEGLPPNTEIIADTIHTDFMIRVSEPGGNLGGRREEFNSTLIMNMVGTGDLDGFARMIAIPALSEVHTGPRVLGDPVQTFPTDMFRLEGQIFGDPDFDVLIVRAGNAFGLPSPGQTMLTLRGDGQWTVDSFFDVFYEIEFQGAPGSVLSGMSGTTRGVVQMQTGSSPTCVGGCPPGKICLGSKGMNADGTIDVCCQCVSLVAPNPVPAPHDVSKDRYISINPATNGGNAVAHRVTRAGSSTPWYVSCALQDAGAAGKLGLLVPNPEFCVWVDPVIHVRGCEIVPGNTYRVESTPDNVTFSLPLSVDTTPVPSPREYGDLGGSLVGGVWTAPDTLVTAQDIVMVVQAFQLLANAPHVSRVDTDGKTPNGIIAGNDILREVLGFAGQPFGVGVTGCPTGTCVPSCP